MARQFYTLDLFTDTALGGNPLAVVLDSDGLDDARMQGIAAEFNLSETVFVFPPVNEENRASLRIFTPKNELPFAGHPTVGTAILLARLDGLESGQDMELMLEEKVGLVPCQVSQSAELRAAKFALPKLPVQKRINIDRQLMARALGINANQLGLADHQNSLCDAGVAFPAVPLADLEAMENIKLNPVALAECFEELGIAPHLYVYTRQCAKDGSDYHVRLFAPAMGIPEDPATGSAAAGFAAQIMAYDRPKDGSHLFVIEQGIEMGRPSRIELGMEIANGELVAASIGGSAVIVSEGKLHL
jgi:trans-2,3-dihydro-3-hydroxyanthranilate isomerase